MPDRCAVCNQDFQIEPGFYIGALWTSFPIVIFIMAFLSILLLVFVKMELEWFFVSITVILLLLQPIIIRLGRAIWINIFVDYDPEYAEDAENKWVNSRILQSKCAQIKRAGKYPI